MKTVANAKGFTLVEVLIAMSIMAFLSGIVGVTMVSMFDTRDYFEERYERFQVVRNAVNRMSAELASAYMAGPQHGGKRLPGEELDPSDPQDAAELERLNSARPPLEFGFVGKPDRVDFTAFAHVRTQQGERNGHHAEISYFVRRERDPVTGKLVEQLVRREDPTYDDDMFKGGSIYVMIPEIEELEFEYWDPGQVQLGTLEEVAEGRWVSDWNTDRREFSGRLPSRVKITVVLPPQNERSKKERFVIQAQIGATEVLEF
ncbi:MAG: type II secretion system protein [Myxococcota bacterium]